MHFSFYDNERDTIQELLAKDLTIKAIWNLLYKEQGKSYAGLMWYCRVRKLSKRAKEL